MQHRIQLCILACALVLAATAHAQDLPGYEAYHESPRLNAKAPARSMPFQARVTAMDEQRSVPTFVWAHRGRTPRPPHATPAAAARWYLHAMAASYRLSRAALATAYVHHVHDTGRGGILVTFRQAIAGIEVHMSEMTVLLDRELRLVAVTGNLHEAARVDRVSGSAFRLGHAAALARAMRDLYGIDVEPRGIRDMGWQVGNYRHFDLVPAREPGGVIERAGIHLTLPARVKPVYYPLPDRLVPAYFLELFATMPIEASDDTYAYVVAADTGQTLSRRNLTFNDSYQYRVWADSDGLRTPLDGPQADFTPHPTGVPGAPEPPFIDPVLITMEGFNAPDGAAAPDPWLPAGATETLGNNVDAYADHFSPDGLSSGDRRAAVTAAGVFDYLYDPEREPLANTTQVQAAIVQLFYINNWLHDYFYDSGFDEAAGNAQQDNFGRGGIGGDPLRAEAQDNGPNRTVRNNANMLVPADGISPRMQMFLWTTPDIVHRFEAFEASWEFDRALFGPNDYDVSGPLVLANDGAGDSPTDACEPLQNDVDGAVVLIDRGLCSFASKAERAQNAGAAAVVIANTVPGERLTDMGNLLPPLPIDIPVIGVTFENANALRAALATGSSTAVLENVDDVERDGTIDNASAAHEWGHYIHDRLVDCITAQCAAQGEGWGDFIALLMVIREGDDYAGAYALSGYAAMGLGGDSVYFGTRRVPYSVDPGKNALSFRHISDGEPLPTQHPVRPDGQRNSEVHAAGEIWTSMMLDAYVALLQQTEGPAARYDFDEARRRMADYVVAGMMLAPSGPTYTEQRDAVLAAALARDPQDMLLMAQAFARRGAGTCAVAPPRNSADFVDVVEDGQVRATMRVGEVALAEGAASCDGDGVLDAGEDGVLTIAVENPSTQPLAGTELTVTTTSPRVGFPAGNVRALQTVPAFGTVTVEVPVTLDASASEVFQLVDLALTLRNQDTCETTVTRAALSRGNFDVGPARRDDAESAQQTWSESVGEGEPGVWRRSSADGIPGQLPGSHLYHGDDLGRLADASLVSPELRVSAGEPFTVTFQHRHDFEADTSGDPALYFDGGVIEISTDGGATFDDVAELVDPGYSGVLLNILGHPLRARPAFVGRSPGYPAMRTTTLDFGTALAGSTVILRFRIGTDFAAGADGWDIDAIEVGGIDNQPFLAVVADATPCGPSQPPPDAGPEPGRPDAGMEPGRPDAGMEPGRSDAGMEPGRPDAGPEPGRPDAGPAPDPEKPGDGGGCGCAVGADHDARGSLLPVLALGALGLLALRRRRARQLGSSSARATTSS